MDEFGQRARRCFRSPTREAGQTREHNVSTESVGLWRKQARSTRAKA
jgi:hypothetical protein